MSKPVRLRLSRAAGFCLQEHSRRRNGLAAINVARPSKFGNPFRVGHDAPNCYSHLHQGTVKDAATAVRLFRRQLQHELSKTTPAAEAAVDLVASLHGKNLACWCAPGEPCHADVLLELANPAATREAQP